MASTIYHLGETVHIRDDLSVGGDYKYGVNTEMEAFKGKQATITKINDDSFLLDIDGNRFIWNDQMMQPNPPVPFNEIHLDKIVGI